MLYSTNLVSDGKTVPNTIIFHSSVVARWLLIWSIYKWYINLPLNFLDGDTVFSEVFSFVERFAILRCRSAWTDHGLRWMSIDHPIESYARSIWGSAFCCETAITSTANSANSSCITIVNHCTLCWICGSAKTYSEESSDNTDAESVRHQTVPCAVDIRQNFLSQ